MNITNNDVQKDNFLIVELMSRFSTFLILLDKLISFTLQKKNWIPDFIDFIIFKITFEEIENFIIFILLLLAIFIVVKCSKIIILITFFLLLIFSLIDITYNESYINLVENFSDFSILILLFYLYVIKKHKRKKLFKRNFI